MQNARTFILAVLTALLIVGCATVPKNAQTTNNEETRVARNYLQSGDYLPAAQEYLRLAGTSFGDTALAYRLDAASAFVLAKRTDSALKILDDIRGQTLSRDLQLRQKLVQAQLALADQHPEQALKLLEAAPPEDSPPDLLARYHSVRADAFDAAGEHIESARERVQLELLLTDSVALSENRRKIWLSLTQLSPQALEAAYIPPPSTLGGWIELAAIGGSTMTDPNTLSQAIALWRHRYPGHPAGENVVPMLMEDSHIAWAPARTVALLLPFEGQFAKAAAAVRDGFLAAWYADPDTQTRPAVLVRDSAADGDIWKVYNQAVEEGADFVVGPLERTAVTRLASSASMPVPTLTLNHADTPPSQVAGAQKISPTNGLFQFALSPESEAQLVAEHAWFAGHTKATVLAPLGVWGQRVTTAFVDAWQSLGGTVVEVQSYLNDGSDMSTTVSKLLDVDDSESRYRALTKVLGGEIKHEARRRQDVDFVFMAAFPIQARQLRPQLEFHRAEDLPVYSTSHVYSGIPDPNADRDIDGVVFGDMPWVLDPAKSADPLRVEVGELWPNSLSAFIRLYAFGADAYSLVKELGRLRAQHYAEFQGMTGTLSLNENNRIDRRLTWAKFIKGTPRIIDSTMQ